VTTAPEILFHATIVPHRSLSRRGWTVVLGGLAGLGTIAALRFALLGLWPVIACMGAEAILTAALLAVHARAGRASEVLLLEPGRLRVLRTDPSGRRCSRSLQAGWLNAVLEETPGRVPRLLLVAHGRGEEIATALGEHEKRELAQALAAALRRMREPRFDNPQLRE
jgi:uncharacterized membrane protein